MPPAVEQEETNTGQYVFRGMVDEEPSELPGQLPSAVALVSFEGRCDGPSKEVCGLLTTGCSSLTDRRVKVTGEIDIEHELA
ncbi:hypothetical protein [Streptomyces sp. NPDC057301]|uniref:hypothetical protein n=1 Tax=Streptomyces sp. NPDC057301 TaxID=3346093 RepID=UPI0036390FB2